MNRLGYQLRVGLLKASRRSDAGYTLTEALIVVVIISILMTVSASGWLAFRNRFALNKAQDKVLWVLKQAQSEAKLLKSKRQASFRMQGNLVQWAVHDVAVPPSKATWYDLGSYIRIDPYNTTLHDPVPELVWRMQFDDDGSANGQTGRLTLVSWEGPDWSREAARSNNRPRRCIFISTLIGTLRADKDKGCVVRQ
jgi:prepilin-type N-terminal cleavage/methylation domain-containing protein